MATRPAAGLPKLSRRSRILIAIGLVVLFLLITGSRLINTYINWLWYGEVGYRSVYSTELLTQLVLFFVVGIFVGGVLAVNLMIAFRTRPVFVPVSGSDDPLSRYRSGIIRRLRLIGIGIPALIGLIAGLSALGDWQLIQLFLHGTSFGTTDPVFGKDIGFYAFTLPFVLWLKNWLFIAITIAFFGALIAQYLFGGIRLAGRGAQMSGPARMQLAILAGLFVLLKAFAYFTDRYELLYSQRNAGFNGASYTDLNALMPSKLILLCIAVFCAVAFFAGAFLRNLQLPALAFVLLVLSSVLVGWAWPQVVQQFSVRANQNQKEAVSIQRNIEATQQAYGLTDNNISYNQQYDPSKADVTPSLATSTGPAAGTIGNIRLLDPNVLSPTFTQKQRLQNIYGFPQKLNIDRYTINGVTHDYVVAVREINPDNLNASQGSWINRHMVYTHGDGFVAARADQVDASGYPNFLSADLMDNNTGTDANGDSISVSDPRVYYGLLDGDYAIVGGQPGQDREYDTAAQRSTYNGSGGVSLSNWFTRLAFALHYGERNFVFSDEIGATSKIIYMRNPIDRVSNVAPWLTVDGDPYPAVVNDSDGANRIAWIVDGYTTLQNYPYAQQESLATLTNDSLTGVRKQPDTPISYIRNSVKAVVDAYTGRVTLYSVNDSDPVLRAWENVFPGTVKPSSQIPPGLAEHFRYPEDLFNIQRNLLAQYHVTNPQDFFSQRGFWAVPNDPAAEVDGGVDTAANGGAGSDGSASSQPPYYVLAQAPGQSQPTFQLTTALTGLNTQNMAAWVSVSSDPGSYGKFTVLRLPTGTQTLGPVQMQSQFESTPRVTENRTLFNNPNVKASYGNLLTLPVGGGVLFVEPIYIQRNDTTGYPQLVYVLTGYSGGTSGNIPVGFEPTLNAALTDVFAPGASGPPGTSPGPNQGGTTTSPSTTTSPPPNGGNAVSKAVDDINAALQAVLNAQKSSNFQQLGDAYQQLQNAINEYKQAQASASSSPTTAPAPSPTPSR